MIDLNLTALRTAWSHPTHDAAAVILALIARCEAAEQALEPARAVAMEELAQRFMVICHMGRLMAVLDQSNDEGWAILPIAVEGDKSRYDEQDGDVWSKAGLDTWVEEARRSLRALAPLDSTLCVVPRATVDAALASLKAGNDALCVEICGASHAETCEAASDTIALLKKAAK